MDSVSISDKTLDFLSERLEEAVSDVRDVYESARQAGDRQTKLALIKGIYDMEWKPTIGFIADAVNEPRAVILATIQDQNWSR